MRTTVTPNERATIPLDAEVFPAGAGFTVYSALLLRRDRRAKEGKRTFYKGTKKFPALTREIEVPVAVTGISFRKKPKENIQK